MHKLISYDNINIGEMKFIMYDICIFNDNNCLKAVLILLTWFSINFISDSKDYCPIGAFTTMNRDKWAEVSFIMFVLPTYTSVCLLPLPPPAGMGWKKQA